MTDREKAIVMAYTGIAMLKGEKINEFYKYLAELYGRPVYTHEIVTLDIAERAKPDFIRLCEETHDIRTQTHPCDYGRKETHGDVIYRDVAIDALEHKKDKNAKGDIGGFYNKIIQNDIDTLMQLPSVEPERKTGKWAMHTYMPHNKYCSNCKKDSPYNKRWDFCPNCGSYNGGKNEGVDLS